MPALNLNEMAVKYGITPNALSYYEEKGLLCSIKIGTLCYYDEKNQMRLQLIIKGQRLGFTLHEIGKLIAARDADKD